MFIAFFLTVSTFAQGYEILYKNQDVNEKYLYLTGIYGNQPYRVDSAKGVKQQYLFKNAKQSLPAGFYTIQTKAGVALVDFIVDKTQKFGIETSQNDVIFTHSEENTVYRQFKKDLAAGNDLNMYAYTAPESLLGKYVLAQYIPVHIPEFHWGSHDGRNAAAKKRYQFIIDHYFDNIDFKDTRLMNTPLNVDLKDFFLTRLYPQTPELMISCIDNLFQRILDEKPTKVQLDMRDIYLKKLIHLYMTADAGFDTVFVYLVDNYVSQLTQSNFISDAEKSVFQRIADRKRKTLVGETVPVFKSYNKENQVISTAEIPANYIVLWFWDPDCEHCLQYTPILCDFYHNNHDLYNFEVLACSVTEDYDRWLAFIHEHHLDWINTSYAIAPPNYDAVEYFNFADTPAIFIIDKQQKIVARQFPLDNLQEIFESLPHDK